MMEGGKILVPVDFSAVTPSLVQSARYFAGQTGAGLVLLHVKHIKSDPSVEQKLRLLANEINSLGSISCGYVLRTGSIFTEIAAEASLPDYLYVIIGTHGFKGFREIMLGADILRLLKTIPRPVLTIQQGFAVPENGLRNILFPVASHNTFFRIVNATAALAKRFDSTVHIYSVEKPGLAWTQKLTDNIRLCETTFEKKSVKYVRVNETQTSFSLGYSKQTLEYAARIKADLIAMMSVPAKEHFYFADGDKEQLLTNKYLIPVITISDKD